MYCQSLERPDADLLSGVKCSLGVARKSTYRPTDRQGLPIYRHLLGRVLVRSFVRVTMRSLERAKVLSFFLSFFPLFSTFLFLRVLVPLFVEHQPHKIDDRPDIDTDLCRNRKNLHLFFLHLCNELGQLVIGLR